MREVLLVPDDGALMVRRGPGAPAFEFDQALADEFLERMEAGETVTTICAESYMPSWPTICRWKRENDGFSVKYARAREASAESCEHNVLRIADEAIDAETAQVARVRMDAWRWAASKRNPKTHGDRTVVSGDPDSPLVVQHQLAARRDLLRRLDSLAEPVPLTIEATAEEPGPA